MPKLTPELFTNLPKEIQDEILQNVPVQDLNNIRVISLQNTVDDDSFDEALHEAFDGATKYELQILALEILKVMIQQKHMYEDLAAPPSEFIRGIVPGMISAFLSEIRDEIKKGESE